MLRTAHATKVRGFGPLTWKGFVVEFPRGLGV